MQGGIAKIVKDVTASGDARLVLFIFLWSNIHCTLWVSNVLSMENVVLEYLFEYINPFGVTVSLEQARKFINSQNIPSFCNFAVRMFYKLAP